MTPTRGATAARGLAVVTAAFATAVALSTGATPPAEDDLEAAAPVAQALEPVLVDPDVLPATTTQYYLARDPFTPIRPAVVDDLIAGGDDPFVDPVLDPVDPDDPLDPAPVGDDCVVGAQVVCDGEVVTLVDVDGTSAVVRVDHVVFTVAEGQTFAGTYRVVTIDGPCVTLLHGDDAFTLCEGEQVLK